MSTDGEADSDYKMIRVPRRDYEKIMQAREQLQKRPDYSWVGPIALGAFIGYLAAEYLAGNEKASRKKRSR